MRPLKACKLSLCGPGSLGGCNKFKFIGSFLMLNIIYKNLKGNCCMEMNGDSRIKFPYGTQISHFETFMRPN